MATTTNLGLSIYDTASGSATTFLDFRLALAGYTSNMTIVDNFAGAASGSITNIKNGSLMNVNASYISSNYYEGTNSQITSYVTNMFINLKLNVTITGATTLNINGFGTKTLKKVNSSGNLVDFISSDLLANKYYLFIYNGTYFVLVGPEIKETFAHGCSIYSASAIDVSGSTKITFDMENYDTDGFHTSASTTIPSGYDGYYHITLNGEWGTSGSGYYWAQIDRNDLDENVRISESGALIVTGSFVTKKFSLSGDMYLNSGCTVSVYAGQNTTGSTIPLNKAKFMLDYLGQ